MQQKFLIIEGISLSYVEQNPNAVNTIFFIHGNSSSSAIWQQQFESRLLDGYRLVAFDLPAHGLSDFLSDPGLRYSLPQLGKIMAGAVDELKGAGPYIVAGLSLGTNIVAEMLAYNIVPSGIVAVGSCMIGVEFTMEQVFKPGVDIHAAFTDQVAEEELKQYASLVFNADKETAWQQFAEAYYKVKDNFRSKMFATVAEGVISDQVGLLKLQAIPALVIFGEDEKICDPGYLDNAGLQLWQNTTYRVPGSGHWVNLDQPDKLNELVGGFAKDVLK